MRQFVSTILNRQGTGEADPIETGKKKSYTPVLVEAGWKEASVYLNGNFIPVIPDSLFAIATKLFLDAGGVEISGNFYINPGSHKLEYLSVIANPQENSTVTVTVTADQAAGRLLKDRANGFNPNGQWHTHGFGGAFWSDTDLRDQVKDIKLAMAFKDRGERYFMCISTFHFLIRRVRWDNETVIYQDSPAYLANGRELSGYKTKSWSYSGGWKRSHDWDGYGLADNPLIKEATDILDLASIMHNDPDFHEKLSLSERKRVFQLAEKRYGNLFGLTQKLGTVTVSEAVNVMFSRYGIGAADVIMKDADLIESMEVTRNEAAQDKEVSHRIQ